MRKIVLSVPITLDGFIEGPHRELDWVIADDELHDFYTKLLQDADLLIYGRVTYELMVNYWPMAPSDPNATGSMKHFAETLNPMRKLLYSTTLKQVGWNTQLRSSFNPQEIQELKSQPGKNILLSGGATLAQEFIKQGLVDEYIPMIQPAAIGNGKTLFGNLAQQLSFAYQWSQRFQSGAVAISYHLDGRK